MSAPIEIQAGWSSAPPLPGAASNGTHGTAVRYKLPGSDDPSASTAEATAALTHVSKLPGATYTLPVVAIHQLPRVRAAASSAGMASQKTGDSTAHKGRTSVGVAGQQYVTIPYASSNALANIRGNTNGKQARPVGSSDPSDSPVSISAGKPSVVSNGNGNGSGGFYSFASLNRQYPPPPPISMTRRYQSVAVSEAIRTSPGKSAPVYPSLSEGSSLADDSADGTRDRMRAASSMSMSPT